MKKEENQAEVLSEKDSLGVKEIIDRKIEINENRVKISKIVRKMTPSEVEYISIYTGRYEKFQENFRRLEWGRGERNSEKRTYNQKDSAGERNVSFVVAYSICSHQRYRICMTS